MGDVTVDDLCSRYADLFERSGRTGDAEDVRASQGSGEMDIAVADAVLKLARLGVTADSDIHLVKDTLWYYDVGDEYSDDVGHDILDACHELLRRSGVPEDEIPGSDE